MIQLENFLCEYYKDYSKGITAILIHIVPRAQKKKTNALQVPLPRRLSWPCVSDLQLI